MKKLKIEDLDKIMYPVLYKVRDQFIHDADNQISISNRLIIDQIWDRVLTQIGDQIYENINH
jgi:hypothetical protein